MDNGSTPFTFLPSYSTEVTTAMTRAAAVTFYFINIGTEPGRIVE
jgi:hypothetical protein